MATYICMKVIFNTSAAPPQPSTAMLISKTFGRISLNVTRTWDMNADRIDNYYITISGGYVISVNQVDHTANVVNVPYNMNITTEIIAGVCGLQGESLHSVFIISEYDLNQNN